MIESETHVFDDYATIGGSILLAEPYVSLDGAMSHRIGKRVDPEM